MKLTYSQAHLRLPLPEGDETVIPETHYIRSLCFSMLSLCRYLCYWTVSPRGIIHPVVCASARHGLLDIFILEIYRS
jgi:hypothetical protein